MSHQTHTLFALDSAATELASFSTLLRGRSDNWSQKARALKYELEYKPVEQERRRVATELHDEVLPLLARLSRYLQASSTSTPLLERAIHEVVETIRDLLGELHPVDLEVLGLNAAVNNLCARYTKLHTHRISYKQDEDDWVLPDLQQLAVYRALQLVLRMFAQKGSGNLLLSCETLPTEYKFVLVMRNSDYSAAKSLISEMTEQDLEAFSCWSEIAQMQVQLLASRRPHSVIFSINRLNGPKPLSQQYDPVTLGDHSKARLLELEYVVTTAQEEWAQVLKADATATGNMAVAIERQRLCRIVEELVYPGLEKIGNLALQAGAGNQTKQKTNSSPDTLSSRIAEIKAALDNVITAAYPNALMSLSLIELIALLVERFKRATLLNTKLVAGKLDQLQDLALEKKIAAFRIIQEALHNIEKHSQATTVLLLVEPAKEFVLVCVEDNGLGIGENNNIHSRGMRSVKERAQEIGASVSWQKSISYETGTLVTITLPLS